MTTTGNKPIELGEADGIIKTIKDNFRQQIINIISTAPEYNENDPEIQAFINLWVSEAWEEYQGNNSNIKLKSHGGSENIW